MDNSPFEERQDLSTVYGKMKIDGRNLFAEKYDIEPKTLFMDAPDTKMTHLNLKGIASPRSKFIDPHQESSINEVGTPNFYNSY